MADDIQSNIRINIDTASAMDSIRLLQNQISAFHTQMSKMGAASVADSRNMQQNLINSINSTGAFTANMTKVKTTAEQFTSSLEKNKLSMGEYFRYAGGATKTFGKLFKSEFDTINKVARERVKDLQSQYIKLGRDANGAMQAIRVRPLTLDMDNLATKTQIAAQRQQLLNQLLKQGSTNLLNFGKNTQWAGRQLMVGFTIPLSIMGGAAIKAYKEIEEAAIRLKRVYGDLGTTNMETEKMVKEIQLLAQEYTKYGVAVKDSMDMAATAAATGKKGADLLAQVASSARLAVLGGVDQQMALKTTISLTDAFGVSTKQLAKDINFLNAVENQTVLSIEDMTTAIPKAAPVIQQLGGDVKDLAFFLTAMKEGGINASESANALKSGLASLINPTNTASKMLQGFGINLREIVQGNKGDVKKTVVDFAKALDTLDPLNRAKAIEQLFGKFQFARMSTLFKNVIEQGSQASEVLKLTSASSLELSMLAQRELAKIESSPLYKFQKSIADFQAQLAPVGEQFMKALTPVINFAADVLKNFNSLNDGVKGFIVKFVAVAGVVGPVLLMSFGLIANAVANVIKGFALMKDIFNKTGKSSLSLGEQVNYMTQEQIQAAAIASSLDQVHSKLKQTFTSEAAAVDMLTAAYERSVIAQRGFAVPVTPRGPVGKGPVRKYAAGGIISGPGTGTSDSILAMVSNGEAIIPASSVARNPGMVRQLVSGKIPGFADGLVPAYTNAVALLSGETNQALKTGVSGTSLASEIRQIGPGMNAPIVEAIAKSLGAKNNNQVIGMLRNNPDLRSFAQSIQVGVAQEMDAIGSRKIQDPELSKIYQTVARREAAARGQLFVAETEKFLTTPTTFEDTTTTRQRSSGRVMSIGRATLFSGLASYRNKNYKPIAQELGTDPTGLVKAHMSDRTFISLKEATTKFGIELSNQAKAAADRMANGIIKVSQSIKPRMQQAEAAVAQGMAEAGKMQSPSRVTKQKGAQLVQGAVQGIQEGVDDVRRAGTQLGLAAAQGVSQSGRVAGRGSRRASSEGNLIFLPGQGYVSEGQLARDTALANAPVQGPKEGNRFQRFRAGLNVNSIYKGIQGTEQEKLSGGIRNKAFGASGAMAVGSMLVPGEAGQMMGMASMLLSFGGMGAGGIAKGMKSLSLSTVGLGLKFLKFVPYVGAAVTAFEIFDKAILPLLKKNADAYQAISKTLSVTQEKLDGINKFFGTDIKLSGIRTTEAVSGGQSKGQGSIAEQFQQSEEFKNIYQEDARKMKSLGNAEFKKAMQAMAADLFGQNMEKEQVTAIIDAIAIEAGKSSVSIAPELFSIKNPETKALMQKNISEAFAMVSQGAKGISPEGTLNPEGRVLSAGKGEMDNWWATPVDPESVGKIKAGTAEITSYMSALSGQFANGKISATEFSLQYEKILSLANQQPGTAGLESLKVALISLNQEAGNALVNLNKLQFGTVSKALFAGVTPTSESYEVLRYGNEEQIKTQVKMFDDAYKLQIAQNLQISKKQKDLRGIQQSNSDINKIEKSINDKYDKRISQIEKIKKLNEKISQSQQGQLSLAEALNKGDISAAAAAAIDIQKNDIQNALDTQQTGLEDSRKQELVGLSEQRDNNTQAITTLNNSIQDLILKGIVVKTLTPEELNKIITPEELLFGTGINPYDKDVIGTFKKIKGIKTPASGGHITGAGSGTSDSIPAMLSNGEYVIRANAVKTIGVDTLDKLNQADKMGFAAGGMVRKFKGGGYNGYEKGGKVKNWELKDPSAPWNQGDFKKFNDYQTRKQYWAMSQPGSRELVEAGKTAGYFMPGIGAGLSFGDAGTAFGKGDVGGGLLNTAFGFASKWLPEAIGMVGKGIGAAKSFVETGIATMNAKKVLGIMGGKEASKLTPEIGVKMTRTGLENFINQGKYKTIHEGVRSSAGDSVSERLAIEAATGMNKALKLKPGQSPAYAFLGTKEAIPHSNYTSYSSMPGSATEAQREVLSFLKLVNPYSRPLQTYGSSMLKLGKGSLKNATVSFGDSLSIYQQAVKAGAKTPQVLKLGSLLTTFRLSSMAKRTKNILGNEFSMPYAEIHMRGGFGLDDVKGIGVSTEWKDRVPEAIASMEHLLANVGRSNIPVHDILGRGRNALSQIGESIPKRKKYSVGGMVPVAEPAPRQFANGGYAMGTDTVPAMLTPGEFVIKKSAVDRIGTATLNKINGYANGGLVGGSSAVMGDSVYNYSVNVNVATDSDPNQIARAVMSQIRKVDNHRVRGSSV